MASQQRVNDLLERGLQLFGLGQQSEALALWQEVLQLEPQNPRAQEYLRFVSGDDKNVATQNAAIGSVAANDTVNDTASAAPVSKVSAASQNPVASTLLGQSWADLLSSAGSSPASQKTAPQEHMQPAVSASLNNNTHKETTAPGQVPAPLPQADAAPQAKAVSQAEQSVALPSTDSLSAPVSADANVSSSETDLPQRFSAGSLLTSQPAKVEQPVLAKTDKAGEVESVSSLSADAHEQNLDPWEEGESITQTVSVSAGDEFLEPLSGEFDIEEHDIEDHDSEAQGVEAGSGSTHSGLQPGSRDDAQAAATETATPKDAMETLMQGAREMLSLGDFSGALELVERVLQQNSEQAEARDIAQRCSETLLQMYESKIGDFSAIPRVTIPPDDVIWLNLHHRAGFLLSQIDGTVSYDDILSLSGMSRFETCKILVELLEQGVVAGS